MEQINEFCVFHEIPQLETEITKLFLDIILTKSNISISTPITNNNTNTTVNKEPIEKKSVASTSSKPLMKWASKAAKEYANTNNLDLDDFNVPSGRITKTDVIELIKSKNPPTVSNGKAKVSAQSKKTSTNLGNCKGLTKKGEQCSKIATVKPENAKNCYCFKHSDNWRVFEAGENSDTEIEPETPIQSKQATPKINPIQGDQIQEKETNDEFNLEDDEELEPDDDEEIELDEEENNEDDLF